VSQPLPPQCRHAIASAAGGELILPSRTDGYAALGDCGAPHDAANCPAERASEADASLRPERLQTEAEVAAAFKTIETLRGALNAHISAHHVVTQVRAALAAALH